MKHECDEAGTSLNHVVLERAVGMARHSTNKRLKSRRIRHLKNIGKMDLHLVCTESVTIYSLDSNTTLSFNIHRFHISQLTK